MDTSKMTLKQLREWMDKNGYEYEKDETEKELRPIVKALVKQQEKDKKFEVEFREWCYSK